jgi:hypothetical protein
MPSAKLTPLSRAFPFALSLSKAVLLFYARRRQGFDKLSPNGVVAVIGAQDQKIAG